MKTIIAGSRDITNMLLLEDAIYAAERLIDPAIYVDELVCGGCYGVDEMGHVWATDNDIPIKMFPANWKEHGRAAGPIRNKQMAEYADALIAIWDGKSKGTKNMIEEAHKAGLVVYVHKVE